MPSTIDVQDRLYQNGCDQSNRYRFVPGSCVLPLAEDPPNDLGELATYSPVVVLLLHAPYRIRDVRYGMKKINNPPILPSPKDAGAFVFLGGTISVSTELNQTLANFDWDTETVYTYVENCVSRIEDGLVLGRPPYDEVIAAENRENYPLIPPLLGAIAHAGADPVAGYQMGLAAYPFFGDGAWGYNCESYLSGVFFDDSLVNGGPPLVP